MTEDFSQFAWMWGHATGAGVIVVPGFFGWNLRSDYKSKPDTKGEPVHA